MRKQCAPGLLFPSPRRPGYEAILQLYQYFWFRDNCISSIFIAIMIIVACYILPLWLLSAIHRGFRSAGQYYQLPVYIVVVLSSVYYFQESKTGTRFKCHILFLTLQKDKNTWPHCSVTREAYIPTTCNISCSVMLELSDVIWPLSWYMAWTSWYTNLSR